MPAASSWTRSRACAAIACLAFAFAACGSQPSPPDTAVSTIEDPLTGQNGALAVTTANQVVNQYGVLAANVAAGASTLTITNAGDFTATAPFTTGLAAGDLLMIYQPQGATISGANSAVYGSVTALGGAGSYELVHVASVAGTTVTLETSCGGLQHAYTAAGATEVIRIPQVTTLSITGAGSLTAAAWDGARGGVLAVQAQTTMAIGGGGIDVSATGFRGGATDNVTTNPPGTTTIRSNSSASGAEKGEGIAGYEALYDSAFNGRYGRGAPANGGGGGDAHNAGGGGGANGDSGNAYTGAGVMDNTVTGAAAWAIDPDDIANGGLTTSSGGGRGGFTFAGADQNALTDPPGSANWGGDSRRDVGGLGGRPLANDPAQRLFLGGGGGAGDGNNNVAGKGGNGGGLVLLIADGVSGTGSIVSDGQAGASSAGNPGDAPGGAGAGGTIVVKANTLTGVTLHADGGAGGNQTQASVNEAEGPGGGGGGGFIAISGGAPTQTAAGALGGTTNSSTMTEFPSDGATSGAAGQTNVAITGLPACTPDDLSIALGDGVASIAPGKTTTYTIVATNNGADVINGATVTDAFPATLTGVTWTCTATAGSTCSVASGAGNLTAVSVKLAPGGSVTFTATGTIDPAATGTLADTATVAAPAGVTDTNLANNTATDSDALVGSSDLSIAVTDSPDPVTVTGALTYTVNVSDAGPSNAAGLTMTDTLPAGVTFVSASGGGWACAAAGQVVTCTRAALAVGAAPAITISVTAPAAPGTITDSATIAATTADPAPGNNTATQQTIVGAASDLSVVINDTPDPVPAGGTETYTVTVTNSGPSTAQNVTVVDNLPPGATFVSAAGAGWTCTDVGQVVTCTIPTLAAGASVISIVVTAPTTGGTITNTATASSTTGDPNPANNTGTSTTTVTASADLSVAIADAPDPVTVTGTLTYTVTVANAGPSTTGGVTLVDTIPAGTTLVSATGAGWTCTRVAQVITCTLPAGPTGPEPVVTIVVTAPAAGGTITDTATVSSATPDPVAANNTATADTTVSSTADLAVTVTAAPDPVAAGAPLTYTVHVTNGGPSVATAVTVTDTLPAGATFVSAAGAGWACSVAGQVVTCTRAAAPAGAQPPISIVATAPAAPGAITDTVTVAATTPDPSLVNNSASQTTTVNASTDLAIAITDAPDPVITGGMLIYAVAVTNGGPSTATGLSVTDTLPAGVTFVSATGTGWSCAQGGSTVVCTMPSAPVGALAPISIVVSAPATPGPITDTASASSATADPNLANNTASQTTTVIGSADLAIALAAAPDPVVAGSPLTYTVSVANGGPSAAQNLVVTDTLPAGTTFVSAVGAGWACGVAGRVVTCTRAIAAPGAVSPIAIVVTAPSVGGTITDTASVAATTGDPNLANNTATLDTIVSASADLAITLAGAPNPVPASGTLTYTVGVTNNGPSPSATLTVTDTLPAGAVFGSAAGAGWACSAAGQVVTCTRAAAAPGAQPAITIIVAAPPAGGSITDTASVTAVTADPNLANNTATTTTTVTPPPTSADLAIALAAQPSPVGTGGTLIYTASVTNLGPDPAQTVTVTDTLPAGVTLVSATGTGWTCAAAGSVVTCTVATLPTGAAPSIAIVVTATVMPSTITDSATIGSAITPDPNLANNTATLATDVVPSADLAITLHAAPDPVAANGQLIYTIGVVNFGPSPATNVVVTNTLPPGAAFGSGTGSGWTCSATGQLVTCTLANLNANMQAGVINLIVAAPSTGGPLTDTATVSSDTADPVLTNNTATITTNDSADADLSIAITASPEPVQIAGTLTYTVSVADLGPSDASGVAVRNTLPAGVTIVTQPHGTGWVCTGDVCTRPSLGAGMTSEITFVVTAPITPGTLTDAVKVTGTTPDPDSSNNAASVDTDVSDSGIGVRGGGCDGAGGGGAGGLVAVLGALALTVRRRRWLMPLVAAAGALVVTATPAHAQVPGAPESFSVERMRLSIDGDGLLDVEWASVHEPWHWNVATWVGLENDPLVVYATMNNQRTESLVHNRFDGSLLGAVGVASWLELGLQMPLIYDQTNSGVQMVPSPASPKLGDLTFAPKLLLRRGGPDRTSVGLMLALTAPTGGATGYVGPDGVSFIPELIVSRPFGDLRISGNLGYVAQPQTKVVNLNVDDELFLRFGLGYRLGDATRDTRKPLELDATFSMSTAAASPFGHVNTDVYEVDGAVGYDVTREVTLYGLTGGGIGAGVGSPDWRVVIGARFTRREAKPRLDRDGDGLYDDEDKCPDQPEDKDGFQDEDGCPDPDNDGDGIPDVQDRCPNEPEDKDGFQDEDGCPDPDNDGDGILDVNDKCPNEPEDMDGFKDADGCPDPDNDGDGVLDAVDRCPQEPGPKDNDGCPDPDRDGDGVVDRLDNCPDVKGPPENAGCPTKQLVKIVGDKLEIIESVYFKLDRDVIEKRSYKLLDNVAAVINAHPALVIQVEGHTDSQGNAAYNKDLSQRRAAAVADYLARKGVDPANLKPVGFGMDKPIADNKTATGRAQNRRVVFTILSGSDGQTIENRQQGADDSTKEKGK